MALFKRLKAHLSEYKWWQGHRVTELADYCRVSRKTIYNWMNGKTKPKQAKLRLVEEWLNSRPKGGFENSS